MKVNKANMFAAMVLFGLVLFASGHLAAQEIPVYTACLDVKAGTLYNLAPGDMPAGQCKEGDIEIRLSGLQALLGVEGIDVLGEAGKVDVGIAPSYQLPQSCEQGQIATFANGEWVCADALSGHVRLNPLSKVWLAPYWLTKLRYRNDLLSVAGTLFHVVNPGNQEAEVNCLFSDYRGTILFGARQTFRIPSGGTGICTSPRVRAREGIRSGGWGLIYSTEPVIVHADFNDGIERARASIPMSQLDCNNDMGIEFLCAFVPPQAR